MGFSSLAFLWHLHTVFALTAFVGGILFIAWAMKLKPEQLKKWVMWLLVIGVLGSLLTCSYSFVGWQSMMGNFKGGMMESGKMMMDYNDMQKMMNSGIPGEMMKNR